MFHLWHGHPLAHLLSGRVVDIATTGTSVHAHTWRAQCHRASIPGHHVVLLKCIYPYLFSLALSSFSSVFYEETEVSHSLRYLT